MQRVKENREKGWSLTRNSPLKAPDTYMQVDVHLLTLSSMLFLIKTVKLCFITNVLKKEQAENFTVYYEKNKEFFVCNTFKNFVQYKIGFTDFFFITTLWQDWRCEKTWTLGFDSRSKDWVTVRTCTGFTKAMVHMLTVGTRVGESLSTAGTRIRFFAGMQALMFSHMVLVFKSFPTNIAGVFTRT